MKLLSKPVARFGLMGGGAALLAMIAFRVAEWACLSFGWLAARRVLWSSPVVAPIVALLPSVLLDGKPRSSEALVDVAQTAIWVMLLGGILYGLLASVLSIKGPTAIAVRTIVVALILFYWYVVWNYYF